jgi:hypothetical protein
MLAGYVWDLWQHNTNPVVSKILGKNGLPLARIAPVSDEPDLADSGKTYILYGFAENEQGPLSQLHTGAFAMRVISKNFAELSQVVRIISGAFETEDWAAESVNAWTSGRIGFDGIRFTSICATYIEAADAATVEGGTMEGTINLKYRYVIESNTKTYRSGGWYNDAEYAALHTP